MPTQYDVIIIGAGPAGIFAAAELARKKPNWRILILEKGNDIQKRYCPMHDKHIPCIHCKNCSITSGWGGAGAYSDGKLTLTTEYGGWLGDFIGTKALEEIIAQVDDIYVRYGGNSKVYGMDLDKIKTIQRQAATADLRLIPAKIRHLGTDKNYEILTNLRQALDKLVEIRTETTVEQLLVQDRQISGVVLQDGSEITARFVIAAPGREGHEWFSEEAKRLNLPTTNNQVDIGVRVEVPAVVMSDLTDAIYESKFIYYSHSFDDQVRTFCMNPYGEVVMENTRGLITVNGHSYADMRTENTNFALLVAKTFTQPFNEPIAYGKNIAALANMLGDGVIVQRLGDLQSGRRSTEERIKRGLVTPSLPEATPGDLSLVMPYRHLVDIMEMLAALDKVAPGVNSRHTLLYGVEAKFYSNRMQVSNQLETKIHNLFAVGDGAGITRGLVQASASGLIAGRVIAERDEKSSAR
ncbi:MAG: NAD(P)/FAD-dependent oxidoreductase [Negativicutes bacterium]|nr:NAD(P)/FAD-dependent oxidoreductase [Negativicutes bacterium]